MAQRPSGPNLYFYAASGVVVDIRYCRGECLPWRKDARWKDRSCTLATSPVIAADADTH
jgi:hypothetical protein